MREDISFTRDGKGGEGMCEERTLLINRRRKVALEGVGGGTSGIKRRRSPLGCRNSGCLEVDEPRRRATGQE